MGTLEQSQEQGAPALVRLWRALPKIDLLIFGAAGIAALLVGFVLVHPYLAKDGIVACGYYFVFMVCSLSAWYAGCIFYSRRHIAAGWVKRPRWIMLGLALACGFGFWSEPFKHKILYDEYVLQATALHLHSEKEVSTPVRAFDVVGTWLPVNTYLDKRPYFFAFVVSVVHDLTGYRVENAFAVNAMLAVLVLLLLYWLARTKAGVSASLFGVALIATMPLFAQNATSAGMEVHNLAVIAAVLAAAVLYLRAPDEPRLSLLVLGGVLLTLSRYESATYVFAVAGVVLAGWIRAGRVFFTWPARIAPLLLIPCAWHSRVLGATPELWELFPGQTSRFSLSYFWKNFDGDVRFFFFPLNGAASSIVLSWLGVLAVAWIVLRFERSKQMPWAHLSCPSLVAFLLFGAAAVGNLGMTLFYYWSKLDDVMASRFALPFCFVLALLVSLALHDATKRARWVLPSGWVVFSLWLIVWGVPVTAQRFYTDENVMEKELKWEIDFVADAPSSVLVITNKSSPPFLLKKIQAILIRSDRSRDARLRWHLQAKTFGEVYVMQCLRATSANGDFGIDPDDELPASYRLETVKEKRFGHRLARISRLIAIDDPAADKI
jgi:hypothetical protein